MSGAGLDLLDEVLDGAADGDMVVGNGALRAGWYVYPSSRGGSWVADMLRRQEGEPQTDRTLHLRTADRDGNTGVEHAPTWHRSYFRTHFARPTVHCSFRVDGHVGDDGRDGFKLAYLHQGNNHSYYVMLHVDGRAQVWREARDSAGEDGRSGVSLASGRWDHQPGVRRHLTVVQDDAGTITAVLDGRVLLRAEDPAPWHSGQIGFRLDGLDARVFSLVVRAPESWETHPDVADWAREAWQWGLDNGILKGMDAKYPSRPTDEVTKQEFIVLLRRYHLHVHGGS